VGICVGIVLATVAVIIVLRVRKRRAHRSRRYSDHFIHQTAMALREEDILPNEQKCIREEIAERQLLKSFSPIRKDFYNAFPSDASLSRRGGAVPMYQTHDVLHHSHPYIGQNFINPIARRQQPQQYTPSLHHNVNNYVTSSPFHHHPPPQHQHHCRKEAPTTHTMLSKCSHGSRYQVPVVVRHDSLKSSLSQQSSFYENSLDNE